MKQKSVESSNPGVTPGVYQSDQTLKELADEATSYINKDNFLDCSKLGLTERQYNALIATLALMEQKGISEKEFINEKLFRMDIWADIKTNGCGSVCCIGGTASLLADGPKVLTGNYGTNHPSIFHAPNGIFLGSGDLNNLFYNWGSCMVTVERAAEQLRRYLETGKCSIGWAMK